MAIDDKFSPNRQDGGQRSAPRRVLVLADDGAITIADGVVFVTKAAGAAITIADPPAGMDGAILTIISTTAAAHTVTYTAGFAASETSGDVATFGGAAGDNMTIVACDGVWYATNLTNVTLG